MQLFVDYNSSDNDKCAPNDQAIDLERIQTSLAVEISHFIAKIESREETIHLRKIQRGTVLTFVKSHQSSTRLPVCVRRHTREQRSKTSVTLLGAERNQLYLSLLRHIRLVQEIQINKVFIVKSFSTNHSASYNEIWWLQSKERDSLSLSPPALYLLTHTNP